MMAKLDSAFLLPSPVARSSSNSRGGADISLQTPTAVIMSTWGCKAEERQGAVLEASVHP